jgi:hypothetical protein
MNVGRRRASYRRSVRRSRFAMRVARRLARKQRTWLDRLVLRLLLGSALRPRADFMRDELVDAGIGFTAAELDRYQRGLAPPSRGEAGDSVAS